MQPDEHLAHGGGQAFVHREPLAAPVARRAEPFELLDDPPAGRLPPFPDALDEPFPPQFVAGCALGQELALDDVLRGDPGVVGARLPQGGVAPHAMPADEDVLQRVVQGVTEVERARDVRRRDDDAVRGRDRRARVRSKPSAIEPGAGPAGFDLAGSIDGVEIGHRESGRGGAAVSRRPSYHSGAADVKEVRANQSQGGFRRAG